MFRPDNEALKATSGRRIVEIAKNIIIKAMIYIFGLFDEAFIKAMQSFQFVDKLTIHKIYMVTNFVYSLLTRFLY